MTNDPTSAAAREIAERWRQLAVNSREEAGRIRRTIKDPTDAEMRCLVRAEVWDQCADELHWAAETGEPPAPPGDAKNEEKCRHAASRILENYAQTGFDPATSTDSAVVLAVHYLSALGIKPSAPQPAGEQP